jgi:hypothetical protein
MYAQHQMRPTCRCIGVKEGEMSSLPFFQPYLEKHGIPTDPATLVWRPRGVRGRPRQCGHGGRDGTHWLPDFGPAAASQF